MREPDSGCGHNPARKEVILLAKSEAYYPIQSIGDIYHLILTSAGYDRYYEAKEYLEEELSVHLR